MSAESELISVCQEIGFIAECNCHYTHGLADLIELRGQNIQDMTIAELLSVSRSYSNFYNKTHGQAISQKAN